MNLMDNEKQPVTIAKLLNKFYIEKSTRLSNVLQDLLNVLRADYELRRGDYISISIERNTVDVRPIKIPEGFKSGDRVFIDLKNKKSHLAYN